jgi:hypothetical protein
MLKRILFMKSFSLIILFDLLFAANVGKIVGRITDLESGKPLIGANVIIEDIYQGSTTDESGDFSILNVHPGSYTISISYIGYEIVSQVGLKVNSDKTTHIDKALKKEVIKGSIVTVIAEAPLIDKSNTASKHIVTSEMIAKQPIQDIRDVLETQAGIFQNTFRGDSRAQSVFFINGISTNSGLFSDNFTGFNLSAIQEISVMTGGYSAEYGEARAAVVNVVEKMTTHGIHGTMLTRLRPAGKYHFGRNIYSRDNHDITGYGIDYWTDQSENPISSYHQQDPQELLVMWEAQSNPDPVLGEYAKRDEWSSETTLYGSLFKGLNFLFSSRGKKGVGIFPQSIPYNREQNIQGYLDFNLFKKFQIRIGGFMGERETAITGGGSRYSNAADYLISNSTNSNFDSGELSEEYGHLGATIVAGPYDQNKYNPMGVIYDQFPELREWYQAYIKFTLFLNQNSFLKFNISQLSDAMDRSDRYDSVPDSLWSRRDDTFLMVTNFRDQGYFHAWDRSKSKVKQIRLDYTNQYTKNQQIKLGLGWKKFDIDFEHFMASHEGGGRWNLNNVFQGKPHEGHFYLQDLIEYPEIILNLGFRIDYFNQNRNASANMFDPTASQTTTPGHDPFKPMGFPGEPETEPTEIQLKISPRLGLSHPVSDNALLHFSYGHFYQRPSWAKMLGFPFVNYTTDMSTVLDPFADQITYMEQWQGFYGNPRLGYERSIQYELGLDLVYQNKLKFDFTGYYKDSDQEASVITGLYGKEYTATKALIVSNGGYSDTRGVEIVLETKLDRSINAGTTYDIYWSYSGNVGYQRLNETGSEYIDLPIGLFTDKRVWSGFEKVKGWISYDIGSEKGPTIFGMKPFSDFHAYTYFWWRSGTPYTYHAPGDLSTRANNKKWFSLYQFNLKVSKGLTLGKVRAEISMDIRNIFDSKFLRLLYYDELKYYHENTDLPIEDRLPKNQFSGEPDVWEWYTYEVPPKQIDFQLKIDF